MSQMEFDCSSVKQSASERILRAAKSLFANEGFNNTTTLAIARCAGTSESQLLKKFGSKEGILEAILDGNWSQIRQRLRDADSDAKPGVEHLCNLITAMTEFVEGDDELKALFTVELQHVRRRRYGELCLSKEYLICCEAFEDVLERMRDREEIDPTLLPQTLRSCIFGMIFQTWWDSLRYPANPAYSQKAIIAMAERFLFSLVPTETSTKVTPSR